MTIRTCYHSNHNLWTKHLVFFQVKCKAMLSNFCWFSEALLERAFGGQQLQNLFRYWAAGFAINAAFVSVTLQLIEVLNLFQEVLYSVISEPMHDSPLMFTPYLNFADSGSMVPWAPRWDFFQITHLAYRLVDASHLLQMQQELPCLIFAEKSLAFFKCWVKGLPINWHTCNLFFNSKS